MGASAVSPRMYLLACTKSVLDKKVVVGSGSSIGLEAKKYSSAHNDPEKKRKLLQNIRT